MDILKRLNQDMANIFSGANRMKGLCPYCGTVQPLFLGRDGNVLSGPYYLSGHEYKGEQCVGSYEFVPDEIKE